MLFSLNQSNPFLRSVTTLSGAIKGYSLHSIIIVHPITKSYIDNSTAVNSISSPEKRFFTMLPSLYSYPSNHSGSVSINPLGLIDGG